MTARKRLRTPKAKPGQLRLDWGRLRDDPCPDIVYSNGVDTSRCDALLLHNVFSGKQLDYITKTSASSFVEELISRGYDITTIKFSIFKKGD